LDTLYSLLESLNIVNIPKIFSSLQHLSIDIISKIFSSLQHLSIEITPKIFSIFKSGKQDKILGISIFKSCKLENILGVISSCFDLLKIDIPNIFSCFQDISLVKIPIISSCFDFFYIDNVLTNLSCFELLNTELSNIILCMSSNNGPLPTFLEPPTQATGPPSHPINPGFSGFGSEPRPHPIINPVSTGQAGSSANNPIYVEDQAGSQENPIDVDAQQSNTNDAPASSDSNIGTGHNN
jgi:hypothetical protein